MILGGQQVTPQTMPATWATGSWGNTGVAICRHCQRSFSFTAIQRPPEPEPEPERIVYPEPNEITYQEPPPVESHDAAPRVVCCPECGQAAGQYGRGPKVTSTRKTVRHYRCTCGARFKATILR